MIFFLSNSINTKLSQLTSVPVTTYLDDRRVVTKEVAFVFDDFLRNHNILIKFDDCFRKRRNSVTLIHISHN